MAKEKDKNLKYRVFPIRLSEETKARLKTEYKKCGVSWNKFVVDLLKQYDSKPFNKSSGRIIRK
jgi:hypothetical protein